MESDFPYRRMILFLLSFGLLIYFLGSFLGFFQSCFTYLVYFSNPKSFYVAPFLVFELYPRFVLVFSNVWPPIFYEKFSLFSIIFLAAAVTSILFTFSNRTTLALIFCLLASLVLITHHFLMCYLVGLQPAGFGTNFNYDILAVYNVFYVVFSSKNLFSTILAALMYVVGLNLLSFKFYRQKIEQIPPAPLKQKFQTLKSIYTPGRFIFPMIHFLIILEALDYWLVPLEFPYYNATFSNSFGPYFYSLICCFILLISIPLVLEYRATNQSKKLVAEALIPFLGRELAVSKPLIQIWDFKSELGLEPIDRREFREVLKNSLEMIREKENIHFGFLRNHFYFVEPLVDIAREKIRQAGQADVREIANELNVDFINLKEAYKKMAKKKLLENVKITRAKILPTSLAF